MNTKEIIIWLREQQEMHHNRVIEERSLYNEDGNEEHLDVEVIEGAERDCIEELISKLVQREIDIYEDWLAELNSV